MPIFDSDSLGGVDDEVVLTVGAKSVAFAESYEVHRSVFSQPSAYSIRTGSGETAATLANSFQPGQQFQLSIGGNLNQTGLLEDIEIDESVGASEVTFRGRDWMALLQEGMVDAEKTFANATYLDLVKYAMQSAGLGNNRLLVKSNLANRKLQTGIPIQELQHFTVEQLLDGVLGQGGNGVNVGVFQQQIKSNIGESLHAFVRRYLDRAGLVFFCAADGSFVVTVINVHQTPAFAIERTGLTDTRATVNVEHATYQNFTAHRHSEVRVYGRGGGRKGGHAKMKAAFEDAEIKDLYGLHKVMVIHDNHIKSDGQALYLARRRICDERRAGYQLTYVVTGHTTQSLIGGARATWAPDTVVTVRDDILGISGNFYLEACEYKRDEGSGTTTTLHLNRTSDLLFGEPIDQ